MRIPQLLLPVGVLAIRPELAEAMLLQVLAFHSLVVAVRLSLVILLLLRHLVDVLDGQRPIHGPQLFIAMRVMAFGAPIALLEVLVVLAHDSLELLVQLRIRARHSLLVEALQLLFQVLGLQALLLVHSLFLFPHAIFKRRNIATYFAKCVLKRNAL